MSDNLQVKLAEMELERLRSKKTKQRNRSVRIVKIIFVTALFIYLSGKVPYWLELYFSS